METELARFYGNKGMREAVQDFLIEHLGNLAVKKSFAGDPTTGIHEAKVAIDDMFNTLQSNYGKDPKPNTDNPAR